MNTSVNRTWIIESLRKSLQAMASSGAIALSNMPVDSLRSDELALNFENFFQAYLSNFSDELSPLQHEALLQVDHQLSSMSGDANISLWTDEAVCSHPAWSVVRSAAAHALETFGWPVV